MVRVKTPVGWIPWWGVVGANAVFWPTWTFACGYLINRAPRRWFAVDTFVTRQRAIETSTWYRDRLHIQVWKDHLPEAGAAFDGGFAKRRVERSNPRQLEQFVDETRRAEITHWLVMTGVALPTLWNPWWAAPANVLVAAGSNLPCIAIQRYNRIRLQRLVRRVNDQAASRAAPSR